MNFVKFEGWKLLKNQNHSFSICPKSFETSHIFWNLWIFIVLTKQNRFWCNKSDRKFVIHPIWSQDLHLTNNEHEWVRLQTENIRVQAPESQRISNWHHGICAIENFWRFRSNYESFSGKKPKVDFIQDFMWKRLNFSYSCPNSMMRKDGLTESFIIWCIIKPIICCQPFSSFFSFWLGDLKKWSLVSCLWWELKTGFLQKITEKLLSLQTHSVGKFHDFSVPQILREINFEEFTSCKSAVFVILGALNFVLLANFSLQKMQKK